MTLRQLTDIDFGRLRQREYSPSPAAWEMVLYFLLWTGSPMCGGQYRGNDGTLVVGNGLLRPADREVRSPPSATRLGGGQQVRLDRWHATGPRQDRLPAAAWRDRALGQPGLPTSAL
jgi:hypothetical protein